ncbi:Rieske 2Fe-2S domain-containing protein [Haloarchaeobius sp. HME9146]|uniref:Rieske (2Fe-2S) protein n=1 Tax=Haloarchaeobius sp. HME9146 TaxID=2978732 RepID=UPI0021C04E51|nr:Rieske 2Fe-2S domain-containing protein [Haloarchaeobius sp. HME9146]MCT9095876.1 Rieske 2Fe-2S domain-containing protein [Haloarchaeobius sp. HME9146]
MDADSRVTTVAEVPEDETFLFTVMEGFDEREVVLTKLPDGTVEAYMNYCQHWTDVRLDKGSGGTVRDDELVCTRHAATFRKDDGVCTHGPCEGAVLETVDVTVEDGAVYLTDDDYRFDHVGQASDIDLSSGGRIGFDGP